jgi:hypothetical protein
VQREDIGIIMSVCDKRAMWLNGAMYKLHIAPIDALTQWSSDGYGDPKLPLPKIGAFAWSKTSIFASSCHMV